jgi:hypothetical protein
VLAPSLHLCGGRLPVWATFVPSSPISLAAAACVAAGQCFPELARAGCRVLCPMRPARCWHPHLWSGCPCHSPGVPLPLAVAPRGMPCQPHLHVLVTRGIQLSTEPHLQLSYTVLGGGRWHICAVSSFLTGPLTTGWAPCCTRCWGAVPFGLARRGGLLICSHVHVRVGYGLRRHSC